MKRVIRSAMFETASSSVHAIVVDKHKPQKDKFETLHICHDYYGWAPDILMTPSERASYLWQALITYKNAREAQEKVRPFEKILDKYGINYVYQDGYFDEDKWGGLEGEVDHAESFPVKNFTHESTFLKYLFGDKSCVYLGNDNVADDEEGIYKNLYEDGYAIDEKTPNGSHDYYHVLRSTKDVDIYMKGN